MTVAQCASQMIEIEEQRGEGVCARDRLAVGAARVGSSEQKMVCGTLEELMEVDMGPPLHSLVLVGRRAHELEKEYVKEWAVSEESFERSWGKYQVEI